MKKHRVHLSDLLEFVVDIILCILKLEIIILVLLWIRVIIVGLRVFYSVMYHDLVKHFAYGLDQLIYIKNVKRFMHGQMIRAVIHFTIYGIVAISRILIEF